jgi:16S rRNA (uracil1498-N3)-methyltransferase
MRLTRVFVDAPLATGALLPLPEASARHLARVLRAAVGDPLIVFNGRGGEFAAQVQSLRRNEVAVRIGTHEAVERESPLDSTLLQGIARGDKMDQILQKATELGVTRVIPVLTARSNVRLDADAASRKHQHWRGVVVAACEQCGRNRVPELSAPMPLEPALDQVQAGLRVVMSPDGGDSWHSLLAAIPNPQALQSIALLVGPEGGLDAEEIRAARQCDFQPCSLGPRVLRTETAALAMLAGLQFGGGDLGRTRG